MRVLVVLMALCALVATASAETIGPWTNTCPNRVASEYCDQVGKYAYNAYGIPAMRAVKLGRIVGVSWRPKGSLVGHAPAIPEAGIPKQIRLSPRNAYYYIIDDGGGDPFLRMAWEIDAKHD